ncbi:MAG: WG repeat-containing protein [Tissierellia bacterium]|nr:WG repeat-containing protein [Tissierellia bacterium]
MRKKVVYILTILTSFIILFSYNNVYAQTNVRVKLPSFKVTINGEVINNEYSEYPLIIYKDITYFPMTYAGCRYLGLETKWNNKSGLEIVKTNVSYPYSDYITKTKNHNNNYASVPSFNIKINGKVISNQKEVYPLLVFRDVTYFPLTWKFGVDEFGWDYHFDSVNGLVINSQNLVPKVLNLHDYYVSEHKPEDKIYYYGGEFILFGDYIYYAGNKGAIYKATLDNLQNYKKIYDLPLNDVYFPEGTYAYPYFENRDGKIYLTYHIGGASMGSSYEVKINSDDTVSEPVSVGIGVAPSPVFFNGYALDWSSTENSRGFRMPRYKTENFDYLIAFRENVENDLSRIYKLNKTTNEITLVSEKPTSAFKYRDGSIYFISNDNKLYGFKVSDDIVKTISNGPVYNFYTSGNESFEVINGHVYYQNSYDDKIYKEGIKEPLNSGEECYSINRTGEYVVLKFKAAVPNSYRTIIYNKEGKEILKTPKTMQIISTDSNRIAYYDEIENNVYLVNENENSNTVVKPKNIFINNTADSEIITKVTSLSQYKYGVAKICVDGRWFYIDKKGNEVSSLNDLSIVNNINIPNSKPLIEYKNIEKIDDVLLLRTDDFIQCVDLNNGKVLFEEKGRYYYDIDNIGEGPFGYYRTTLGNNQRAIKISSDNEELTIIVNVDTKEILKVNCFRSRIQEGLYQYKENGLFGFKNIYNQVIIPAKHPQSLRNTLFAEGFAMMQKQASDDRTFVFYDRKGNEVFEIYLDYQDEIFEFQEGLAKIGRKYLYGYIDTTGKFVIEPQYSTATGFSNGVAIVSKNGKYGVIYSSGEVAIPLEYESMKSEVYRENSSKYDLNPNYPMLAKKDGKWGYVNFPYLKRVWPEGQEHYSYEKVEPGPVVPFIYDNYPERDVMDLPSDYDYIYHSPYAIFKVDDKLYAIGVTLEGEVLTPEGYDMLGYYYEFQYGLLQVMKDGKLGFLDSSFEVAIPLEYTGLAYSNNITANPPCFMDEVACVSRGEKLILIDREGNELLYFN